MTVKFALAEVTGVESACVIPIGTLDTGGRSFPAYYPIRRYRGGKGHEQNEPTTAPRPRLSPELWPEIAARAADESLRRLAAAYGVSHETIRTIVRRMAGQGPAAAAACVRSNHAGAQQPGSPTASARASSTATRLRPESLAG